MQKKSREESHGEGSGVEIIINEPYNDGPGGKGQYTKKIYHVGSHLPGWIKSKTLFRWYTFPKFNWRFCALRSIAQERFDGGRRSMECLSLYANPLHLPLRGKVPP